MTDTTMLWVYYKYNENYMQNWDIVGLNLRINFYQTKLHDEYIVSFLIYTFDKYISSYIFKCIDFGATPSYSTQECMQSFLHPIYLWCSRCFKSHKSQIRKMKVQRLQQKIQWYRKCNILIRQKIKWKRKK